GAGVVHRRRRAADGGGQVAGEAREVLHQAGAGDLDGGPVDGGVPAVHREPAQLLRLPGGGDRALHVVLDRGGGGDRQHAVGVAAALDVRDLVQPVVGVVMPGTGEERPLQLTRAAGDLLHDVEGAVLAQG